MRRILKTIIGGGGDYTCSQASSGAEALDILKTQKFNLILLDVIMEDNGIDTLREILKIDKMTNVIMVTAVNQEAEIKKAMDLGAKAYIVKPFNKSEILTTINELFKEANLK